MSHDRCHGNNVHKFSSASTVTAYCETTYACQEELATLTHRETVGGCKRFNNAVPVRVTTAINYIIRPNAQTIVNKNNIICLPCSISEPFARSVNVDIQCINVLYAKNKVTSVADGYKCHTVS